MQETKNKIGSHMQELKKKERHIVTWSQQEDDILRQQIKLHGTENWSVIASKFEDKTTRQCRRRWYTYLNSDFKKGGWSPEEDLLLCEAQKIFGNRWTEIAKVVSGRTDNAVKNRFSTLCKKKAKYEALVAKENTIYNINANKKRVLSQTEFIADGSSDTTSSSKDKIRRTSKTYINESCNLDDGLHKEDETRMDRQIGASLAVLIENLKSVNGFPVLDYSSDAKKNPNYDKSNNLQGVFLKKENSKISALLRQRELLSSLGLQVQTENTDQSLENAWKVLKDFLYNSKDHEALRERVPDVDLQPEDLEDFMENLRCRKDGNHWRQHDQHESPSSSECSSGSNFPSQTTEEQIKIEQTQTEEDTLEPDINSELHCDKIGECNSIDECEKRTPGANAKQEILLSCDEQSTKDAVTSSSRTEFSSPQQVTPIFRSLAAGIPSPVFSESERNFLIKTLGLESPNPYPSSNTSQAPSCKRVLLQTTSAQSFSMRHV